MSTGIAISPTAVDSPFATRATRSETAGRRVTIAMTKRSRADEALRDQPEQRVADQVDGQRQSKCVSAAQPARGSEQAESCERRQVDRELDDTGQREPDGEAVPPPQW
jgi:hypothetical protein